jgi:hypothetical protein
VQQEIEWSFKLAEEDIEIFRDVVLNDMRHSAGDVQ